MKLYERVKKYCRERSKTIIRGPVFSAIVIFSGGIFLFSVPMLGIAIWRQYLIKTIGALILAFLTVLATGLGELVKDNCLKPKIKKIINRKKRAA